MNKKKILFVSNIAGNKIGSFSKSSIIAARNLDLDFHIAANFKNSTYEQIISDEKEWDIHIHQINFERNPLSFKNFKAYKELLKLVKKNNFDLIHCNTPTGGLYARLVAKKCGVNNVIYQAHGFHFYKDSPRKNWLLYYPVEKYLAQITDILITINKEDYTTAQKFNLRNNGKIYYIPGVGIDINLFENVVSIREEILRELNLNSNSIICISMGDLIPRKNYATAIKAIATSKNHKLHYLICGQGPELKNLKKLSSDLGISERIHFLGYRSDVRELLKAADIFLFTTIQEGMPRSMMEAMATGLPCIASKIRGNTDLLEDNKGGFLVPVDDVDCFADKIDFLSNSVDLRESMGKTNLERIKKFDTKEVELLINQIYSEVLEN